MPRHRDGTHPLYGKSEGERRAWSADELLDELREDLTDADNMGLQGNAGLYAALIDYIEKHEKADR